MGEHTIAKVRLVEWLHHRLGFDVVAIESGFFECGYAWQRIDELSARDALYACLRFPFQHAEILPLFETIRSLRADDHPLVLAGVDPQAQVFDSEPRPAVLASRLRDLSPEIAARVATIDTALFLPEASGGLPKTF